MNKENQIKLYSFAITLALTVLFAIGILRPDIIKLVLFYLTLGGLFISLYLSVYLISIGVSKKFKN